jgi:hypothetical protein
MEKKPKANKKLFPLNSPNDLPKKSHKKAGQFKGELAKHIYLDPAPRDPGVVNGILYPSHREIFKIEFDYWHKSFSVLLLDKRLAKMPALLKHYNIDQASPDKWLLLSMAMACECVPGFHYQFKKKAGAKSLWSSLWYGILWHEVEKIRGNNSASQACGKLSKRRWNGKILSSGTLENKYYEADNSAVGKARRAAMDDPAMAKYLYETWEEISQLHLEK